MSKTSETVIEEITKENTNENKIVKSKDLNDSDEIEVVSLIPNVSYKDSKTLDMYEWDEVGHAECMTFETLKNLSISCNHFLLFLC